MRKRSFRGGTQCRMNRTRSEIRAEKTETEMRNVELTWPAQASDFHSSFDIPHSTFFISVSVNYATVSRSAFSVPRSTLSTFPRINTAYTAKLIAKVTNQA